MISDDKLLRQISQRLSLRKPQERSLEILCDVVNRIELAKDVDLDAALAAIQAEYETVHDFERNFPSLCFALATGVGKTRLMGAMCAFLFLSGRSKNFFILAPNTTIYEKLIDDFSNPSSPKYVFKGISQFAQQPPIIVTGDTWQEGRGVKMHDLFGGDAVINIFNVDKINKDKGKVKRLHEYIGQSYFDYLAELPDLVLMMDEAHRYRAKAGMNAVAELKPVLGIEMTATPKTVGARSTPFQNVIFDYGLGNAMADGYVKEPAVATRADFRKEDFSADQIEQMMLEDAVHVHENLKAQLDVYHRESGRPLVHPFILVVAQDTTHASELRQKIESDDFFAGRYKDRVAEVHSNTKGEESDEAVERLVGLETDNRTEIVIHVNKLKEGWDVTNLYTIVPLRASASDILTEQTLGRGLRLPYGERTGDEAVDTLTVIAHDRFDEVIQKAREDQSVVQLKQIKINRDDVGNRKARVVEAPSKAESIIFGTAPGIDEAEGVEEPKQTPLFTTDAEQQAARAAIRAIQRQESKVQSIKDLCDPERKMEIQHEVERHIRSSRDLVDQMDDEPDARKITDAVLEAIIKHTIEIPEIVVIPTRDVTFGFNDFDLSGLADKRWQPIGDSILIRNIRTETQRSLARNIDGPTEERLENYLVRYLIEHDEVDYDTQADLLYKLAGQMIDHLRSYLDDEDDVENVALGHGKAIADLIFQQMKEHYWETPTDYRARVTKGFRSLEAQAFNATQQDRKKDFRKPITPKSDTKKYLFGGFKKCGYPIQKFDSDAERRFAVLIDSDHEPSVISWIKPAAKQFQIEYLSGRGYEPDFVIETDTEKLIVEVKARNELDDELVQAKARAAQKWVEYANDHADDVDGKRWAYLMIADDEIKENSTLAGLKGIVR
ncbi:DEAD/DEAH box helicase [Hyphobacterium sp.]|uniref:DEAD/DEAH box helicase n=1 Tax=Hyphobacterium sp. TaxID=2004662 RepID=UPI003BAB7A08